VVIYQLRAHLAHIDCPILGEHQDKGKWQAVVYVWIKCLVPLNEQSVEQLRNCQLLLHRVG